MNLKMTRETEQGVQVFSHNAIPLAGGDTAQLQFGNWTQHQPGHPPGHHPQRAAVDPDARQPADLKHSEGTACEARI